MLLDISLVRENFASKSSTHNEHGASVTVGIRDLAIDPWAGFPRVSCIRCCQGRFWWCKWQEGLCPREWLALHTRMLNTKQAVLPGRTAPLDQVRENRERSTGFDCPEIDSAPLYSKNAH